MTEQEMKNILGTICTGDAEMNGIFQYVNSCCSMTVNQSLDLMTKLSELKKRMASDVVCFLYRKKDGSIRTAYGTRVSEIISKYDNNLPHKHVQKTGCNVTFPYFDIEKHGWRSFKVEYMLDINRGYTL